MAAVGPGSGGKMMAVVQLRYGSPDFLELREIDRPVIGDDGVLLRVHAASLNAADWPLLRRLPHLVGRLLGMPTTRVGGREQAAAIPTAGCTALQGLHDKGRVKPGQRLLVYGAGGGVGIFAVQFASSLDAHVTAVTSTRNVDLMYSLGADEVGDYTYEGFADRGQRYDVVFDIVPVIDRQYPLNQVPDALRYLGTRQARGKLVIKIATAST